MGGQGGIFIAEAEDWKRQRRLIVTALNTNRLHRYFGVVQTCAERLHSRLLEAAMSDSSLEIGNELNSYTVDITSALALGHDLNTLERRDSVLQGHMRRIMEMTTRRLAAPMPYWRYFRLPADRALDRSVEEMERAIEGFIDAAKARMAANPGLHETPSNLLEGMLAAQRKDDTYSDREILANVLTILLAGEDTTANTLAWTIWLLASRPEVQARLAAEADEVLGDRVLPDEYETSEHLAYAEAVMRESMRLKGVSPIMGVEPLEDETICDTRIPAETFLLLLSREATITAAGRSEEFYPERWLEDDDETRAPKTLNFGAGPRFCPGRNLAFLESKVALAMIARNFELELDDSSGEVEEIFAFAMIPGGLRVRLRRRVSEG
jgi:cytochrome P450